MSAESHFRSQLEVSVRGWVEVRDRFDAQTLPAFVARHWAADPQSLQLVERRLSIVYRLRRAGDPHYLRISHPSIRRPRTAQAAYHFQAHLAEQGAPVCAPLRSQGGNHIEWLRQGETRYFAGLVTAAPGQAIHPEEREPRVFRAWGRSIAQLHEASLSYRPGPHRHHTLFDFYQNVRPIALAAEAAIRAKYFELERWLHDLPRRDFALTHGDMHPANVFWDGKQATIIDFDEPVYGWLWVDFARALLDFYQRSRPDRRALHEALLAGYREVRPVDAELHSQLPRFMQLRGLLMHLWSLADGAVSVSGPAPHQRRWALQEQRW